MNQTIACRSSKLQCQIWNDTPNLNLNPEIEAGLQPLICLILWLPCHCFQMNKSDLFSWHSAPLCWPDIKATDRSAQKMAHSCNFFLEGAQALKPASYLSATMLWLLSIRDALTSPFPSISYLAGRSEKVVSTSLLENSQAFCQKCPCHLTRLLVGHCVRMCRLWKATAFICSVTCISFHLFKGFHLLFIPAILWTFIWKCHWKHVLFHDDEIRFYFIFCSLDFGGGGGHWKQINKMEKVGKNRVCWVL